MIEERNTFTRFESEGKVYLQTGTIQLWRLGMADFKDRFAEPAILNKETQEFVNEHGITFGDNAITGVPTFVFDTKEKLQAFIDRYKPIYNEACRNRNSFKSSNEE
jgi:hypothetical protein